jgi:hypothetical protein
LPVEERAKALMAVLKADPNQAGYLNEMANLLAQQGMADQSLDWYGAAMSVIMRSGPSRPEGFHDLLINFASQMIIAGKTPAADSFLSQLLEEMPLDPDAWFLKLTVMRLAPAQTTNAQVMEMAHNALVRRWNAVHDEILNGPTSQPATAPANAPEAAPPAKEPAATMPAKVDPLDPASVIAKVKDPSRVDAKNLAESALSDLASFEVYYANQPAAAKPWIDALSQLGAEEMVMARLNGWAALQAGQIAQAREILSKTADKDALARLGLIKADEAEKKPVTRRRRESCCTRIAWAWWRRFCGSRSTQPG